MKTRPSWAIAATLLAGSLTMQIASAEPKYGPGVTDTEIKIGNTAPYTGAFSEYAAEERAHAAYFQMINDRGGVNGRKIVYVSLDDASDSRQDARLARRLVEQEGVLLIFSSFGTGGSLAMRGYLNDRHVPQLFVQSSAAMFDDPAHFPWTMGFFASYRTEASAYARYILQIKPDAKVGVLYPDDAGGREFLADLREGFGDKASTAIVSAAMFTYRDPASLTAQVEALAHSGADVFVNLATGRYATDAIRHAYDIGWRPLQFIPNGSLSIAAFLDPAGLDKATGIVSNARSKGWLSPQARGDPAAREFIEWMKKYNANASLRDQINVAGYERAQALVEVLGKCGDDLTRENVMKQAASLDLELGILQPGIRVTTSPTDYQPIKQLYLVRFSGKDWVPLGAVVAGGRSSP